jgi:hypothetical protein
MLKWHQKEGIFGKGKQEMPAKTRQPVGKVENLNEDSTPQKTADKQGRLPECRNMRTASTRD